MICFVLAAVSAWITILGSAPGGRATSFFFSLTERCIDNDLSAGIELLVAVYINRDGVSVFRVRICELYRARVGMAAGVRAIRHPGIGRSR